MKSCTWKCLKVLDNQEKLKCANYLSHNGLKQASRQWNLKITNALLDTSFTQCAHDYSLFTLRRGEALVLILVCVDDLLIKGNNEQLITEAKNSLHKAFKLKDLGELKYFLGIDVLRSPKGVVLNQKKYI